MKIINKLKKELDCDIKKYSFFNNIKYIDTDKGSFIIKKKIDDDIFINLERNDFHNYINNIYRIEDYDVFPYIDSISIDNNDKGLDMIYLMSNLHNKTSYYKELTLDDVKEIYESKKEKINELIKYYNYLRFINEEKDINLTSYYFLKNMNTIFINLDLISRYLEEWYNIMKNKKIIRLSFIHNNLELSHLIENNDKYLISWDKSRYDIPIYDFINFYKKEYNELDFVSLIDLYENNINISKEELLLLYIEILMPDKIELDSSEFKNIYDLTKQDLYLKKAYYLVLKDNKVDEKKQEA